MAPSSEKERDEFNNITYERIHEMKDIAKLQRLAAFMREEHFPETASAAECRLKELGVRSDAERQLQQTAEVRAATQEAQRTISSWAKEVNGAGQKKAPVTVSLDTQSSKDGSRPPVRSSVAPVTATTGSAAASKPHITSQPTSAPTPAKQDSTLGGQVRSGSEYYNKWDKFTNKAIEELDNDAADVPIKPAAGSNSGKAKPDISSKAAALGGPALTQQHIAANASLTEAEREWNAEKEKVKGNEFFRAKEYTEAIERYTVALSFKPNSAAMHANRAAAYIKLRMWDSAEVDCTTALQLDPTHVKALLRRGVCRLEQNKASEALADFEAGLALDPSDAELISLADKANKSLGRSTLKRMVIEEVSDDDDEAQFADAEDDSTGAGATSGAAAGTAVPLHAPAQHVNLTSVAGAAPAMVAAPITAVPVGSSRRPIAVVEGSSSDDEEPASTNTVILGSSTIAASAVEQDGWGSSGSEAASPKDTKHKPGLQPKAVAPAAVAASVPLMTRKTIPVIMDDSSSDETESLGDVAARAAFTAAPPPLPMPLANSSAAPVAATSNPSQQPEPMQAASSAASPVNAAQTLAPATVPLTAAVNRPIPPTLTPPPAPPAKPEPLPIPSFDDHVTSVKEAGNALYKKGSLVQAVQRYTEAINLTPDNPMLYNNRALARLQSGNARSAFNDAAVAVALDERNSKALHRRAMSKRHLGLLKEALEDLKVASQVADSKAGREGIKADQAAVATLLQEREARQAASKLAAAKAEAEAKTYRYKGGLTIEEVVEEAVDEKDEVQMSIAEVHRIELAAVQRAPQLREKAADARAAWEAQQREALQPQEQSLLSAWEADMRAWEQLKLQHQQALAAEVLEAASVGQTMPPSSQSKASPAPDPVSSAIQSPVSSPAVAPAAPAGSPAAAAAANSTTDSTTSAASVEELKDRGAKLFQHSDYTGALIVWKLALALEPFNLPINLNIALACLKVNDYVGAAAAASVALKVEPANSKALVRRAEAYEKLGRLEDALNDLSNVPSSLKLGDHVPSMVTRLTAQLNSAAAKVPAVAAPPISSSPQGQSGAGSLPSTAPAAPTAASAAPSDPTSPAPAVASAAPPDPTSPAPAVASAAPPDPTSPAPAVASAAPLDPTSPAPADAATEATAAAAREEGNTFFRQQQYVEAIASYTRSLTHLPRPNPAALCNRAFAHMRLSQLPAARADCEAALVQDPTYIKARHRLAQVLRDLGDLDSSLTQFQAVVAALQPSDPRVLAELSEVRTMVEARKVAAKKSPGGAAANTPSNGPGVLLERRRIIVEEMDGSDEEAHNGKPTGSHSNSSSAAAGLPSAAAPAVQASAMPAAVAQQASSTSTPASATLAATATAAAAAAVAKRPPATPRNALEFEQSSKILASSPAALDAYVLAIKPDSYKALFKESLDLAAVRTIVGALSRSVGQLSGDGGTASDSGAIAAATGFAVKALEALTKVNRFSLVVMGLKGAAKQEVEALISCLAATHDVAGLCKAYRIPGV